MLFTTASKTGTAALEEMRGSALRKPFKSKFIFLDKNSVCSESPIEAVSLTVHMNISLALSRINAKKLFLRITLWVALTADRERRASLGIKDGDHLPGKTAKKLVIGLISVWGQLTQFFELGLCQFNDDVKPNIRVPRPGKIALGVNVSGGHIQGCQSF
jgi:hypothetical protein